MVGFNLLAAASIAALTLLSGADAGVIVERGSDIIVKRNAPLLGSCLSYTNYTYVGCYYDSQNPRLLPVGSPLEFQTMTIDKCIAFCKGNNYKYAGLEYYGQCFCGETLPGSPAAGSNCQYPCNGAAGQNCGGNNYMSIFQDPTYPAPASGTGDYGPAGCWSDDTNDRTLAYGQTASGSTMTTESCLAACKAGGFPIAGTEFGSECYCGTTLSDIAARQPDGACTYPCAGNKAETCGGPNLLNLWVARDLESNKPCTSYSGSVPPTPSPTTSKPPPPPSSTSTSKPPPPPTTTSTSKPPPPPTTTSTSKPPPPPTTTSTSKPPPPPTTTSTSKPPPPPPSVTCVGKPGTATWAYYVAQLSFNSIGGCGSACAANSACKAFAYSSQTDVCFLYSGAVATIITVDTTSTYFFFDVACTTYNIPPPPPPPPTTTAPPPPPPSVTCVGKPGTATWAYYVAQLSFNSIGGCGSACAANSACKAFAYSSQTDVCFLYSGAVATIITVDTTSTYFFFDVACTTYNIPPPPPPPPTTTAPPPPPPSVTCVGKPGTAPGSYVVAFLSFNTIGGCGSACAANTACKSFAYNPSIGNCYLYNSAVATVITVDTTSPYFFFDVACTTYNIPPPPPPPPTTTAPPPPPPSVTCVGKPGTATWAYYVAQLSFNSIGGCGSACAANSACKAFAYSSQTDVCFLYSGAVATIITVDTTSTYFFFDVACTTYNIPPSPPTSTSPPLCTTTVAPKCDFQIGNWCAPALPVWNDLTGCLAGVAQCQLQSAQCILSAGWPDSGNCGTYTTWCTSCSNYCKTPSFWGLGICSLLDFKSKNPIAMPPKPVISVGPCTPTPPPTTAAPPPPPPTMTCVGKPGYGSVSYVVGSQMTFANINDCGSACHGNSGCKSFSWTSGSGVCFLYNIASITSLVTSDLNSLAFFFDVGCTVYNMPPPPVTCVGKPGYGSGSYVVGSQLTYSNVNDCGSACHGNAGCKSFSWTSGSGVCFLYNIAMITSLVTSDLNSLAFFFDGGCTVYNMPPPTTPTTPSGPLCTTVVPGKCDFMIGGWCAPTLPSWSDQTGCNTGASQCKVQLGSCWGLAGWPGSGSCSLYSSWCDSVTSYCKTPSIWGLGKCSDLDFKLKNPILMAPTDGSNKPTTIVGPCTPTPTPTVIPVPTYAPICAQPNSPGNGYTTTSPVGGIWMPCLTCNNNPLDFAVGNVFKLFNNPLSSLCTSYKSTGVVQGCKDACSAQLNNCKGTYAQGCIGKVQWGLQDSFISATAKCTQQYTDCLLANVSPLGGGSACGSFNSGWSITLPSILGSVTSVASSILGSLGSLFGGWW